LTNCEVLEKKFDEKGICLHMQAEAEDGGGAATVGGCP
jgi:hypothetical protein